MVHQHRHVCFGREYQLAGKQPIGDAAQGVDVGAMIDRALSGNSLGKHVSRSTGITRKDIRAIILDLKASGQLRAKFNSETGQVKRILPKETETAPGEPPKYCSNCGTPITKESAQYCAYCGGKI